MTTNRIGLVVGITIALSLSACVGTPFRWETARKIEVGMTKAQVTAIMGKPYVISTAGEKEVWQWSYGTGLGTGGAYRIVLQDDKVTEVPKIPKDM